MKKLLALILVTIMIFSFAACVEDKVDKGGESEVDHESNESNYANNSENGIIDDSVEDQESNELDYANISEDDLINNVY